MTPPRQSNDLTWHPAKVERQERWNQLGQQGGTVWFTGLSASGKSTLSTALESRLVERGIHCYRLDGDNVRHGLNSDLGFSQEDRTENIRRLCEVSILLAESGCIAVVAAISPYAADRERCRERHKDMGLTFVEVFVDTPIEVCEQRDPKELYKKARAGLVRGFTGVDAPYEVPQNADLVVKPAETDVRTCLDQVVAVLERQGLINAGSL